MNEDMDEDILFLGFDCSTQSLKVTALDSRLRLVATDSVNFDSMLPHYGTKDGARRVADGSVTCPPLLWVEALELLLGKLAESDKMSLQKVRAVSGSAQQHGSVYWRHGARQLLRALDPARTLASQLESAFAVESSPIWMDSSTGRQCREIEAALGGPQAVADLTGSRALERYTGPHIRKLFQTQNDAYNSTERISLVSSFMASLLVGDYASIDYTDAAAMNLMDLKARKWAPAALQAVAPCLEEKLGSLAAPHAVANKIHPFYTKKYNFNEKCVVVQWSGDNPNSLAGLALDGLRDLAISMGTGDTVFGVSENSKPTLDGYLFPNPVDPSRFMRMIVHENGSLTRQDIRDRRAAGSWEKFNELLGKKPPLNGGNVGFYFTQPEALPPMPVGIHRYSVREGEGTAIKVLEFDDATEVRAIVEGQIMAMEAHAHAFGMPPPERIIATGGASANAHILKVMADIFGCDIYVAQNSDSASLGGALRAGHGYWCYRANSEMPFSKFLARAAEDSAINFRLAVAAGTNALKDRYSELMAKRIAIEKMLVEEYRS